MNDTTSYANANAGSCNGRDRVRVVGRECGRGGVVMMLWAASCCKTRKSSQIGDFPYDIIVARIANLTRLPCCRWWRGSFILFLSEGSNSEKIGGACPLSHDTRQQPEPEGKLVCDTRTRETGEDRRQEARWRGCPGVPRVCRCFVVVEFYVKPPPVDVVGWGIRVLFLALKRTMP